MVLDKPERHKYAMQVTHDLLETDLTMLVGQLNQVLREDQTFRKRVFRVLAMYGILEFRIDLLAKLIVFTTEHPSSSSRVLSRLGVTSAGLANR